MFCLKAFYLIFHIQALLVLFVSLPLWLCVVWHSFYISPSVLFIKIIPFFICKKKNFYHIHMYLNVECMEIFVKYLKIHNLNFHIVVNNQFQCLYYLG